MTEIEKNICGKALNCLIRVQTDIAFEIRKINRSLMPQPDRLNYIQPARKDYIEGIGEIVKDIEKNNLVKDIEVFKNELKEKIYKTETSSLKEIITDLKAKFS